MREAAQVSDDRIPWHRSFGLWELYFAVVAAGVAVLLLAQTGVGRIGALVTLGLLVLWYVGYGRRLARDDDRSRSGVIFQFGVLLLYGVGVFFVDAFSFMLFALCPLAFMTLALPPAAVMVVVLNALLPLRQLTGGVEPIDVLRGPVPVAAVVIVFSIIVGVWLDGVERQSAERAALIAELRATQAELGRLSHDAGVAAERQRLAAELHDTVAQGLSSIIMLIQAAQNDPAASPRHLGLALETARDNLAEARAMVAALPPAALAGTPLPQALKRLVDKAPVPASFTVDGPARPLATSVDVVLLRAAQESLTNVGKHAGRAQVRVRLSYRQDDVVLEVSDNGNGFAGADSNGYGLAAMRGRVEQVSGVLTVDSRPGTGTTVQVKVPTG